MKRHLACLVLSILFVCTLAQNAPTQAPSHVIEVEESSFQELVETSRHPVLLKFYSPTCGHCKAIKGVYEEVSRSLKGVVRVAQFDVTTSNDIAQRFDVRFVPKIMLFLPAPHVGETYHLEFYGDRTVKGIVDFVLKELPVLDIDNADDSFYSLSDMHWPFRIALLVDEDDVSPIDAAYQALLDMHQEFAAHFVHGRSIVTKPAFDSLQARYSDIKSLPTIVAVVPRGHIEVAESVTDLHNLKLFFTHLLEKQAAIRAEQEPHMSHGTFSLIFALICFAAVAFCVFSQRTKKDEADRVGKYL